MSACRRLDSADITGLLKAWRQGDQLRPGRSSCRWCTPSLRAQARRHMRNERSGVTLQSTALVHEVYLRLINAPGRRLARSGALLRACQRRSCGASSSMPRERGRRRSEAAARRRPSHASAVDLDQIPNADSSAVIALRARRCAREPDANRSAARAGHRAAVLRRPQRRGDRGGASRSHRRP